MCNYIFINYFTFFSVLSSNFNFFLAENLKGTALGNNRGRNKGT